MQIIPAINESDFEEIKKKIAKAADFGLTTADGGAGWVHLDVSDGKFTSNLLWNSPKDLADLQQTTDDKRPYIEVHLMVQNTDEVLEDWINARAKRIIVHVEAVKDIRKLKVACDKAKVELVLAMKPETSVEDLLHQVSDAMPTGRQVNRQAFLILAVEPGKAGQKFQENQLEKIKYLRKARPDAVIEVDGGVNLENAAAIKAAGADILIAASAIWNDQKPREKYQLLTKI